MPQIARLNLDLVARTANLQKGFRKAKLSIKDFKSVATVALKGAAVAAGAFAAAVAGAATALTAFVKPAFTTIDVLGKTSKKLGVAVHDLQALQMAASEMAGMEANTFNTAIQRMIKRISYAAKGGGEAAVAFKDMNINAMELARLPVPQALARIADGFAGLSSSYDKVGMAAKIFDSEGVAMVNMLTEGAGPLLKYAKLIDDLGLSLNNVDAEQVEAANDAVGRLGVTIEGVRQKMAAGFAPAITAMANALLGIGTDAKAAGSAVEGLTVGIIDFGARSVELLMKVGAAFQLMLGHAQTAMGWFESTQTDRKVNETWKAGIKNRKEAYETLGKDFVGEMWAAIEKEKASARASAKTLGEEMAKGVGDGIKATLPNEMEKLFASHQLGGRPAAKWNKQLADMYATPTTGLEGLKEWFTVLRNTVAGGASGLASKGMALLKKDIDFTKQIPAYRTTAAIERGSQAEIAAIAQARHGQVQDKREEKKISLLESMNSIWERFEDAGTTIVPALLGKTG